MQSIKVEIEKLECEKCGYQWEPMVKTPKKCPHCQHVPGAEIRNKAGVTADQATTPAPSNPTDKEGKPIDK